MNIKWQFLLCFWMLNSMMGKAQNKIDYPYYLTEITVKNGTNWEGLIFEAKDSSLVLIPKASWRRIKGKAKTADLLESGLIANYKENWAKSEFPYQQIGILEVQKIEKRSEVSPWVGLLLGLGGGILVANIGNDFCLTDVGKSLNCNRKLIYGMSISVGSLIGLSIGTRISIRKSKKQLIKEISNEEWQQVLLEYSILK